MPTTNEYVVSLEEQGERIDKYITSQNPDWSRSQVQEMIKAKDVVVNGREVKANYKIADGDRIVITVKDPEPLDVKPEQMDLDILYEDEDVIVVNKPRGMVVHPAPGHENGTLVNGLVAHCGDLSGINGILRPGIVHRIDKDTSGAIMVAKNDQAHRSLVEQLKDKTTHRVYKAIVHGILDHDKGTIDAALGRDERDRKKMAVVTRNGKHAVTHFEVVKRFHKYSYVECQLETGRTHQIRVHMAYIDHPVAGDPKYGPRKSLDIKGQALHAEELGFTHPRTGERMTFTAPLPDDMKQLLDELETEIRLK